MLARRIHAPVTGELLTTNIMTYDTAGRLLTVKEGEKTTTRTYDSLGRLATYNDGEGCTISYTYDIANNLATITYPGPGNKTVTYTYDQNNRLSTVTDWAGRQTSYEYDLAGRLIKTIRPNGTVRKQIYDAAGQLRYIEERGPASALLWLRALEYDAGGRIAKTHTWPSQTPVTTPAANAGDTAAYDADNRLATWSVGGVAATCTFDDDGNMLSGPSPAPTVLQNLNYTYNAHNQLVGVDAQANLYRYTPDGNLIIADYMRYILDPNAPLSRVLMRIPYANYNYATSLYDDYPAIAHHNYSSATCYIWGANGLEYEITNGIVKTYHPDHLGSTMLLTDSAGAPVDYFEYDSYGTPTYRTGVTDTPFRWHGALGCMTDASGLVYMRARYYNPRLMRFLNQDPIGFEGGMNWYAFVGNNPVERVDPNGLYFNGYSGMQEYISQPGFQFAIYKAEYERFYGPMPPYCPPYPPRVEGAFTMAGGVVGIAAGILALSPPAEVGSGGSSNFFAYAAIAGGIPPTISGARQLWTGERQSINSLGDIVAYETGSPRAGAAVDLAFAIGNPRDLLKAPRSAAAFETFINYADKTQSTYDMFSSGRTLLLGGQTDAVGQINITGQHSTPNNIFPRPPGMTGSVILSVPSPKPPGKG